MTDTYKKEFSAGCVVFRKLKVQSEKFKIEFLLGKHSGYHKWVLPKGLIEKGEKGEEAAIRETEEEIGVKVKIVTSKPLHIEQYSYYANLHQNQHPKKGYKNLRRVILYQEQGGSRCKIDKTVTFYLAELYLGDPKNHGWEMEDAGWFSYEEALKLMSFKGEKEALKKAFCMLVK